MTGDAPLTETIEDGVAILTFRGSGAGNALNLELRHALAMTIRRISKGREASVILLEGAGGAFCAGLDLGEFAGDPEALTGKGMNYDPWASIDDCVIPVIAAIAGPCIGVGLELALCCDIRICAEDAVFADGHATLGLLPNWAAGQRGPRAIGISRWKEMAYTGRAVGAAEAVAWGLANRAVPAATLGEEARAVARAVAARDAALIEQMKSATDKGIEATLAQGRRSDKRYAGTWNKKAMAEGHADRCAAAAAEIAALIGK